MTFAHAGHWLVNLLYVFPLIVVVGAIVRDRIKHRGEETEPELDPDLSGRN